MGGVVQHVCSLRVCVCVCNVSSLSITLFLSRSLALPLKNKAWSRVLVIHKLSSCLSAPINYTEQGPAPCPISVSADG